jgi:type VI protein secretion system component Hcp
MAAVDFFLKLDGIDGESTDAKHKGEIAINWNDRHDPTSTFATIDAT